MAGETPANPAALALNENMRGNSKFPLRASGVADGPY